MEDHPRTCKWLIATWLYFHPLRIGEVGSAGPKWPNLFFWLKKKWGGERGDLKTHHFIYIHLGTHLPKVGCSCSPPTTTPTQAFRLFDDDETGKISFTNLKRVAKDWVDAGFQLGFIAFVLS